MKFNLNLYLFILIACSFIAGMSFCNILIYLNSDDYLELQEANAFKRELIILQNEALEKVDTIFNNNNIYDSDGSDTMADYLIVRKQIDNLYKTQL